VFADDNSVHVIARNVAHVSGNVLRVDGGLSLL